jgi:hypothetical protein
VGLYGRAPGAKAQHLDHEGTASPNRSEEDQVSEQAGIPGEPIYEYVCQFTQVVEYGVSAESVFSGQTLPPAEGRGSTFISRGLLPGS